MARTIQHKRGLEKNLPTLKPGELAFTTDTKKVYIGSDAGNVDITSNVDTSKLATKTELSTVTSQLADTVKEVNGVKPTNGKVTLPIPEVDTSKLATKTEAENIQNQVNRLVLGAVGDGNNPEIVQAKADKLSNSNFSVLNERFNSIESVLLQNIVDVSLEWVQGTISDGIGYGSQTKIRTDKYYRFNTLKELTVTPTSGFIAVVFQYTYNSATSTYTFAGKALNKDFTEKTTFAIRDDYYYRFLIAKSSGQNIVPSESVNLKINGFLKSYTNTQLNEVQKNIDELKGQLGLTPIVSYPSRVPEKIFPIHVGQDGCRVGDEIWVFDGGAGDHVSDGSTTINIRCLNKDTLQTVNWIPHTMGHANGVDYRNTKLLIYNGGALPPEINLFSNPIGKTAIKHDAPENTQIIFKEGDKRLAGDGSACFGEDEKTVYYAYILNSTHLRIHKIRLGMGDNDLSDKTAGKTDYNKWGTFISGKTEMDYNGTAQIIETYDGYTGTDNQPNGMAYDGHLYIAAGFKKLRAVKIKLKDANRFDVVDEYFYNVTDYKGNSIEYHPNPLILFENYVFVGGFTSNKSQYVKFVK